MKKFFMHLFDDNNSINEKSVEDKEIFFWDFWGNFEFKKNIEINGI
jgi:hypothetical protein